MIALLLILLLLALIVFLKIVGTLIGAIFWLIGTLVIAGLASWAAQSWVKYRGSLDFTLISGLIGGVLGIVLAKALGVPGWLQWPRIGGFPVLWTLLGCVIVVAVSKFVLPTRAARKATNRFLR